jgi:DNA polymerase-1
MVYNLVIDADSLLYQCCYRHQYNYTDFEGNDKIYCKYELAYMDFVGAIYSMKSKIYGQFDLQKADSIKFEIIFSPKHTFRHNLTSTYKANRKSTNIIGIQELKILVESRLGATEIKLMEADDIVITRAYEKENVIIACIDKDIFKHSPVVCFNYLKWEWIDASTDDEIEQNYWVQAIMGDSTDGIKGAKGIGIKGAEKLVHDVMEPLTYDKYVSLFESEKDAILSMRLVRLDQFKTGELVLWKNHH